MGLWEGNIINRIILPARPIGNSSSLSVHIGYWHVNVGNVKLQQEDIEESARAELWREELIEEIEQKVGGLRELEDAARKEELVK